MGSLLEGAPPFVDFLVDRGVFPPEADLTYEPLAGGVSSDIWVVGDARLQVVVKHPLADLKVADEWHAPLERGAGEAAYLREVAQLVPGACPQVLAYDSGSHWLAMEYLDPATHRLWKTDLLDGHVDLAVASAVGDRLGLIHELTCRRTELAQTFATDDLFMVLRLEPYLLRVAERHPNVAAAVHDLVADIAGTHQALVHGDASPKNIMVGPDGPVLLDAETAWWGDPAFDVAFCLNHLLLKCLLQATPTDSLLEAARVLVRSYRLHVVWDDPGAVLRRVARLLPALLLARVDGRSPVEYLDDAARERVRTFAVPALLSSATGLDDLLCAWKAALQ